MTMTVIVTRNVAPRFRGFLASVMLEIAPGVYTAPKMSKAVRERVWTVLAEWFDAGATVGQHAEDVASIVMTCLDKDAPGGQRIETLGLPPKKIVDAGGVLLIARL
ncbi:type I-E CRISPR-associated endoribonuclease Cas2 [Rhodomicrobium vannielii ATCC 17100]|uniref:type I-E CRISPR-associated endoribonuclease Cas2e n=1 Tax=Rhodomicrobium vannielii TaxID=1069 RepID=UPI00191855D1|nr:type I-E CRISPR-associated endoribonuclease Cas2e [Rhodomicrobium vannielii]MBJ7533583.1 type I-E CRISPR-associated endoribonuclease Cas2 [Rhodomicrobium vannielii ATCC 17100]